MSILVHGLLFAANIIYLLYELDKTLGNLIPLLTAMLYLMDLVSIISIEMMSIDTIIDECLISENDRRF